MGQQTLAITARLIAQRIGGDGSLDCFDFAPRYLYIAGVHESG
jgi:hypothetical protein